MLKQRKCTNNSDLCKNVRYNTMSSIISFDHKKVTYFIAYNYGTSTLVKRNNKIAGGIELSEGQIC